MVPKKPALPSLAIFNTHKLFWSSIFFPIAIAPSIIDANTTNFTLDTKTSIATYITALLTSIAFTIIFHKTST